MHCFSMNGFNDNDSVDFDFFNNEEGHIKTLVNGCQKDSSKIITKAVIETHSLTIKNDMSDPTDLTLKQTLNNSDSRESSEIISYDFPKSHPSCEANVIKKSLINCLAYEDEEDRENGRMEKCSDSIKFDDKEYSDNSLSDSTLTTITSDLTSVSPCSLMSDSSFSFEECVDSSMSHTTDDICDIKTKSNPLNKSEVHNLKQLDKSQEFSLCDKEFDDKLNHKNMSSQLIANSSENVDIEDGTQYREDFNDICALEEELGCLSLSNQSSTSSYLPKSPLYRGLSKIKTKRRETNLTFNREQLLKIERDNLILLKKIMAHSKPRTVTLNYPFTHKKTSAAINRARQQKKIEQDNYVSLSYFILAFLS